MQRSLWLRWAPHYFRGKPQVRRGGMGTAASDVGGQRGQRAARQSSKQHTSSQKRQQLKGVPSLAYVTAVMPLFHEIAPVRAAVSPLAEQAQQILREWPHEGGNSATAAQRMEQSAVNEAATSSFSHRQSRARFVALRDVLGPLTLALPPPPPHLTAPPLSEAPLADASILDFVAMLRSGAFSVVPGQAPADTRKPSGASPPLRLSAATPVAALSLEETVALLELYDLAACENGYLLLQLLGEAHRFLFGTVPKVAATTGASSISASTVVKLPFPQLLLVLSRLGLTEEQLLQAVVGPAGLLSTQLQHYTAAELAILLVALHRFGLAQDTATFEVVKALRRRHVRRPQSDTFAYMRALQRLLRNEERGAASASARDLEKGATSHNDASATHEPLSPAELAALGGGNGAGASSSEQSLFDKLPPLTLSLCCQTALLVEALTALSVSIFCKRDAVLAVANMLVGNAIAEMAQALDIAGGTNTDPREALTLLSRKLLRATQVCEEMNDPQPLLARCLAFSLDVAKAGVITDGGEDADVPSERRAYYDHVTADLVKVNRTL